MFEQTLLPDPQRGSQGISFAASIGAQFLLVGAALLVPLYFIEALPMVRLDERLLAPPMPKLPSVELVAVPRAVANALRPMLSARPFFAPRRVPVGVAQINDLPEGGLEIGPPTLFRTGSDTGVPFSIGDVAPQPKVEPPPAPKPRVEPAAAPKPSGPVRVGGDVQLAKIVKQVMPIYPPLAKQARIQGVVRLLGVISKDGRIMNLQVLSGHPLLVNAAVDAVKQWIYRPTHLNGEPVEVIAPIDVHFTLSQ